MSALCNRGSAPFATGLCRVAGARSARGRDGGGAIYARPYPATPWASRRAGRNRAITTPMPFHSTSRERRLRAQSAARAMHQQPIAKSSLPPSDLLRVHHPHAAEPGCPASRSFGLAGRHGRSWASGDEQQHHLPRREDIDPLKAAKVDKDKTNVISNAPLKSE